MTDLFFPPFLGPEPTQMHFDYGRQVQVWANGNWEGFSCLGWRVTSNLLDGVTVSINDNLVTSKNYCDIVFSENISELCSSILILYSMRNNGLSQYKDSQIHSYSSTAFVNHPWTCLLLSFKSAVPQFQWVSFCHLESYFFLYCLNLFFVFRFKKLGAEGELNRNIFL